MKLYEIIRMINSDQDEISIRFVNDNTARNFKRAEDIPITYGGYEVTGVYGYDASGYDGIEIEVYEV